VTAHQQWDRRELARETHYVELHSEDGRRVLLRDLGPYVALEPRPDRPPELVAWQAARWEQLCADVGRADPTDGPNHELRRAHGLCVCSECAKLAPAPRQQPDWYLPQAEQAEANEYRSLGRWHGERENEDDGRDD